MNSRHVTRIRRINKHISNYHRRHLSRLRRLTMRIRRKAIIVNLSINHRVLRPNQLQRIHINKVTLLQTRARHTTNSRIQTPQDQFTTVNDLPQRQRATPIAALINRITANIRQHQVLGAVPQGIHRFRRTRFLTLVRMNKAQRTRFRRHNYTNTANTRLAVLTMNLSIARRPVIHRLIMQDILRLQRARAQQATQRVIIIRGPHHNKAIHFLNNTRTIDGNHARLINRPINFNRLRVRRLTRLINKHMRVLQFNLRPHLTSNRAQQVMLIRRLAPFTMSIIRFQAIPRQTRHTTRASQPRGQPRNTGQPNHVTRANRSRSNIHQMRSRRSPAYVHYRASTVQGTVVGFLSPSSNFVHNLDSTISTV